MKDYAVVVRVPGATASNVYVVGPNGEDLVGEAYAVAREAIHEAAEVAGGIAYTPSDGDTWLDQESELGDMQKAVGIIVSALAGAGVPGSRGAHRQLRSVRWRGVRHPRAVPRLQQQRRRRVRAAAEGEW